MSDYLTRSRWAGRIRIPLQGQLDVTYRCNNNCRHCWLRLPAGADEKTCELSYEEIVSIVNDARKMGCRAWRIFGGEPMIRSDFLDIFDYITRNSASYTLNTNGTMITPKIARLLKKKGVKLVAIYGATADVHDAITRNPGSFDAAMEGITYLKEAGAGFTVQIVPMRANYHQLEQMRLLGKSLSSSYRYGATWLWPTACRDRERNEEIFRQRIDPAEVVKLENPDVPWHDAPDESVHHHRHEQGDDRLFAGCAGRSEFHVDPYGSMSFCEAVRNPTLRYDLREGSFEECWDKFIPSLADRVRGGQEYTENCGTCELKPDCFWCPAYGYLEHGRFSAKIDYLCEIARETHVFKENWRKNNRRYYELAGVTIQVDADLPITNETFHPKLQLFEAGRPGEDSIRITHHFELPGKMDNLGQEVYRKPPWVIFKKGDYWIYRMPAGDKEPVEIVAVFNSDYSEAIIYNNSETKFLDGKLEALTTFPTDQVMLAQVLANREACYFHSSGVNVDGNGFLFVGHSEAGKSTIAKMLDGEAEVLCDERIVVRKWPDGLWIHGSWSHGEVPIVSPNKAPLKAICFLHKALENRLAPITDKGIVLQRLLPCLVKPHETEDWWKKTLALIDRIVDQIPCYVLHFDKSGRVADVLRNLGEQLESPIGILR